MSDLTKTVAAILLAHPAEAFEAVRDAKILGPRLHLPGGRATLAGGNKAYVHRESRMFFYAPDGGRQGYAEPGETIEALAERVDRLWLAAGWTLVDADGTVRRPEVSNV